MFLWGDGTVVKFVVVLIANPSDVGGCQVHDGIVHRLHSKEKSIKFF